MPYISTREHHQDSRLGSFDRSRRGESFGVVREATGSMERLPVICLSKKLDFDTYNFSWKQDGGLGVDSFDRSHRGGSFGVYSIPIIYRLWGVIPRQSAGEGG